MTWCNQGCQFYQQWTVADCLSSEQTSDQDWNKHDRFGRSSANLQIFTFITTTIQSWSILQRSPYSLALRTRAAKRTGLPPAFPPKPLQGCSFNLIDHPAWLNCIQQNPRRWDSSYRRRRGKLIPQLTSEQIAAHRGTPTSVTRHNHGVWFSVFKPIQSDRHVFGHHAHLPQEEPQLRE